MRKPAIDKPLRLEMMAALGAAMATNGLQGTITYERGDIIVRGVTRTGTRKMYVQCNGDGRVWSCYTGTMTARKSPVYRCLEATVKDWNTAFLTKTFPRPLPEWARLYTLSEIQDRIMFAGNRWAALERTPTRTELAEDAVLREQMVALLAERRAEQQADPVAFVEAELERVETRRQQAEVDAALVGRDKLTRCKRELAEYDLRRCEKLRLALLADAVEAEQTICRTLPILFDTPTD
jgi:hypothetical protein